MSRELLSRVALIVLLVIPAEALAIINGTLDTSHECVGSLHDLAGGGMVCTGTLIHESWVLTAASCVAAGPDVFAMGSDWTDSPRVYVVDHAVVHPAYSGTGALNFALLHLAAPATGEPVCSALAPGEDDIVMGSTVRHVGFGLTSYPSGFTTQRHSTINVVASMDSVGFYTDNDSSGPCTGDAGGPALRAVDSRVAGVISTTNETCSAWAYDGRISTVYDGWVDPTITGFSGVFLDGFELGSAERWTQVVPSG